MSINKEIDQKYFKESEVINYEDIEYDPNRESSTDAKSYWKSTTSEPLKTLTIGQLVENSATKFVNRIAISTHEGRQLTYAQVEEKTNSLAAAFLGLGMEKGDHIAIWGFNSIEWYLSFIAAVKAGLVAVNVNPLFEAPELEFCLRLSDSKAIILCEVCGEQSLYKVLSKVTPEILDSDENTRIQTKELPKMNVVITTADQSTKGAFGWDKLFELVKEEHRQKLNKIRSQENNFDACNLQFTSGTTSTPKGVMLTHYNLVNNGYRFGKCVQLNEKHHKPCALAPFFHSYGLSLEVIGSISHGATVVIPFNKYSSTKIITCLIENRCTLIYGTPTMFIDLMSKLKDRAQEDPQIYQKLSSVERLLTGGAICLLEVIEKLRKHLPWVKISSGYGMTELSPATLVSMPDEPPDMVLRSCGRLLDHMEIKIVDQNRKIVPQGTPGELCFRGYMVMKGYYNDPEKTAEVIDEEDWFYTGDRAVLLENGYAQIVGRIKDVINRGGEKIQPKDVEETIIKHPAVVDIQVYGVADNRLGEVVAASIIKDRKSTVTEEDIRQFCTGVIASYKIPKYIVFCDNFPRTASGKIQKFKLKNALEKILGLKKQIE